MSINSLMTEKVDIWRQSESTHDGIGGYKRKLTKLASDQLAKIDQRETKERFVDEVLDKEVTHKLYMTYEAKTGDLINHGSVDYSVISVNYHNDIGGSDSHYVVYVKQKA